MEERARLAGAVLRIDSKTGGGTCIEVAMNGSTP
jgi:signal transduction histidine kinase